jgi:hypothetical protein
MGLEISDCGLEIVSSANTSQNCINPGVDFLAVDLCGKGPDHRQFALDDFPREQGAAL